MSDPTRRGLFTLLLAGLAWLCGRRASIAPVAIPTGPAASGTTPFVASPGRFVFSTYLGGSTGPIDDAAATFVTGTVASHTYGRGGSPLPGA